ncbi:hemolysin-III related-domain-containing protein [Mycena leptocephala]|nr:hemolysin-III related-domain-containing protein [Mycena leptocephala]
MATQASRRGRRHYSFDPAFRSSYAPLQPDALASLVALRITFISFFLASLQRLSLLATVPGAPFPTVSVLSFIRKVLHIRQEGPADLDVAAALEHSCDGHRLVKYQDIPEVWRHSPLVLTGYRFIPLNRYPALLQSVFTPHNEFLNIQTHLLPMLLWGLTFRASDPAEAIFTACVLICLGSSVVWHTMSGCAHRGTMEFCARVDYVGVSWCVLISASIGTIVYYGYAAHPHLAYPFLAYCLLMAVAGSILPFQGWFNRYEHRLLRLGFFLALVFCAAAPIAGIAILYDVHTMSTFITPIIPTLATCALGVVFYATHIPERFLTPGGKWARRLESIGGGSHAIWHACIVAGIAQWREALRVMREGVVVTTSA